MVERSIEPSCRGPVRAGSLTPHEARSLPGLRSWLRRGLAPFQISWRLACPGGDSGHAPRRHPRARCTRGGGGAIGGGLRVVGGGWLVGFFGWSTLYYYKTT